MADKDSAASPPRALARAPDPQEVRVSAVDAFIEAWFLERFNNSIVSRHTEIFNYVRSSVDELKRRLATEN